MRSHTLHTANVAVHAQQKSLRDENKVEAPFAQRALRDENKVETLFAQRALRDENKIETLFAQRALRDENKIETLFAQRAAARRRIKSKLCSRGGRCATQNKVKALFAQLERCATLFAQRGAAARGEDSAA